MFCLTNLPGATTVNKTEYLVLRRAPFFVEGMASKPVGSSVSSLKVGMSNMKKIEQLHC